MYIQHGKSLVEHHTHYKELQGYDKSILMNKSEHTILHNKLRKEDKCNIPVDELKRISQLASRRSHKEKMRVYSITHKEKLQTYQHENRKYKSLFNFSPEINSLIRIRLVFNSKIESISLLTGFFRNNKRYEQK